MFFSWTEHLAVDFLYICNEVREDKNKSEQNFPCAFMSRKLINHLGKFKEYFSFIGKEFGVSYIERIIIMIQLPKIGVIVEISTFSAILKICLKVSKSLFFSASK